MNRIILTMCICGLFKFATSNYLNAQNTIVDNNNIELTEFALINWNESNSLRFKNDLSGNRSFRSFEWLESDNCFAFLNDLKNEVIIISSKNNQIKNRISLNFSAVQFTHFDNHFYFLTSNAAIIYDDDGNFKKIINLQNSNTYNDIEVINDNIYLINPNGESNLINDESKHFKGWPLLDNSFAESIKLNEHSYALKFYNKDNKFLSEQIVNSEHKIGCAIILGGDDNYVYVEIQCILNENPVQVNRQIEVFNRQDFPHYSKVKENDAKPVNKIDLPDYNYTYISNPFLINKKGLFTAVTSQSGVHIFNIAPKNINKTISYPQKLINSKMHHTHYSLTNNK